MKKESKYELEFSFDTPCNTITLNFSDLTHSFETLPLGYRCDQVIDPLQESALLVRSDV